MKPEMKTSNPLEDKSLMKSYEIFSRLMHEDKIFMDSNLPFSIVCRWIGADRRKLDKLIKSELGISGMQMMRAFRAIEMERIAEKYSKILKEA